MPARFSRPSGFSSRFLPIPMQTTTVQKTEVARDALPLDVAYPGNPASASAPKGLAASHILPPRRGGRKKVVTSERQEFVCRLLATGQTEKAACLRAGISETAWGEAKKADAALRQRIAAARDRWAELRHRQHVNARRESQWDRSATRKPLPEKPTKQANLVVWHLVYRVSLEWAAVPAGEIQAACRRFNMAPDTWERQERAFGLMRQVYAKRAKLRGQQPARTSIQVAALTGWPGNDGSDFTTDEFSRFRP